MQIQVSQGFDIRRVRRLRSQPKTWRLAHLRMFSLSWKTKPYLILKTILFFPENGEPETTRTTENSKLQLPNELNSKDYLPRNSYCKMDQNLDKTGNESHIETVQPRRFTRNRRPRDRYGNGVCN